MRITKPTTLGQLLAERDALDLRIRAMKEGQLILQHELEDRFMQTFNIVVHKNGIDWVIARLYQTPIPGETQVRLTKDEATAMYVALCKARGVEPV